MELTLARLPDQFSERRTDVVFSTPTCSSSCCCCCCVATLIAAAVVLQRDVARVGVLGRAEDRGSEAVPRRSDLTDGNMILARVLASLTPVAGILTVVFFAALGVAGLAVVAIPVAWCLWTVLTHRLAGAPNGWIRGLVSLTVVAVAFGCELAVGAGLVLSDGEDGGVTMYLFAAGGIGLVIGYLLLRLPGLRLPEFDDEGGPSSPRLPQ